jgi:hypothetical protein
MGCPTGNNDVSLRKQQRNLGIQMVNILNGCTVYLNILILQADIIMCHAHALLLDTNNIDNENISNERRHQHSY